MTCFRVPDCVSLPKILSPTAYLPLLLEVSSINAQVLILFGMR